MNEGELLLRGGVIMTPAGPVESDVHLSGGVIARVGRHLAVDAETIDCAGCWVGPGFVDLHCHLREPGEEWKEDIASGSAAAAAGGYTAVVAMPNTKPPIDSGHLARFVRDRGDAVGLVDVVSAGCISLDRAGEALAHLDDLWTAGVRVFTDDGDTVADAGLLRRALEYIAQLGGVVAQHAVDPGLASGGHMHEGRVSSRLGMQGIPAEAEEVILARDLALVRLTGTRYHAQHLTTERGVRLIAAAKRGGLPVTAEVTPHHLLFDQSAVADTDPMFKMMPPLATSADVQALREAVLEGVVDVVATDHAPHAAHEKDVPFEHAPFGVIGLEWAAAVLNTTVGLAPNEFFERMSVRPAAVAGLIEHGQWVSEGRPANLTVFDPAPPWVPEYTSSKATNSPYLGRRLQGRVRATIHRGRVTAAHGTVAATLSS